MGVQAWLDFRECSQGEWTQDNYVRIRMGRGVSKGKGDVARKQLRMENIAQRERTEVYSDLGGRSV